MSMTLAFGLDAGSTTIKLVALTEDKSISWHHSEATSARLTSQLDRLIQTAREECHADESTPLVATGYGRHLVPDACKVITEIHCHAKGVFASLAHGGTLIDIGGQDTKVIVLDRPNPIGGHKVEGNVVQPGLISFEHKSLWVGAAASPAVCAPLPAGFGRPRASRLNSACHVLGYGQRRARANPCMGIPQRSAAPGRHGWDRQHDRAEDISFGEDRARTRDRPARLR